MALARVRVSNDMNEKLNVQFIIFFLQRLCSICPEENFCEEHFDDRKNIRMKLKASKNDVKELEVVYLMTAQ